MLESVFKFFFLKEVPTQVFSCEICEIFKKTFFTEHLRVTASAGKIWYQFRNSSSEVKDIIMCNECKYVNFNISVSD